MNQKKEFALKVYRAAKTGELHPLFVSAQAVLETGWGKHAIGNNIFGITKGSWKGKTKLVTTTEYFRSPDVKFKPPEEVLSVERVGNRYKYRVKRLFRDYNTIEDCLSDYFALLKRPGYADAWPYRSDPYEYVSRIVDTVGARYATSPDYVKSMHKVMRMIEKML